MGFRFRLSSRGEGRLERLGVLGPLQGALVGQIAVRGPENQVSRRVELLESLFLRLEGKDHNSFTD